MARFVYRILSIIIITCVTSFSYAENHLSISSLQGQWQVQKVLIDQQSDNGLPAHYYIPKYLGRIINITSASFSMNKPEDAICELPSLHHKPILLSKLIAKSIDSRAYSNNAVRIEDMQLDTLDKKLQASYLFCDGKARAKEYGMFAEEDLSNAVWLVKLDKNQIAMSWHDQTILILSPVITGQEIKASFSCNKAGTLVEHKICEDIGLAAFDQSVFLAYRSALNYYKNQSNAEQLTSALKKQQRAWLKRRDECKTNQLCLSTTMDKRIDDLIYDLAELIYQQRE